MPISAIDTIALAFQHTKRQLIQPFRFWQWTRLAVVGLLAGEAGSSGCNVPSNFNIPQQTGSTRHFLETGLGSIDPAVYAVLVVVIILAALVLGIILMYISSVMRFILFDSVLNRACHIREGWTRRQGPGWKYFLWQIGYALVTMAALVILLGIPAGIAFGLGWFDRPREHVLGFVLGGIVLFLLALVFGVSAAVVQVLTKDFVVPQMALEGIGAVEAWRRLWPVIQLEKGGYAAYIGMKILLAIGAGIIVGIVSLILALIVAIPAVGLGIVAVLTGKSAGFTWNAYTITMAIVVGCILLAAFLYFMALVSVPVIVFFPAYSIYFFAPRYRALSLILYPPPPQPPPQPFPEPAG